MEKTFEWSPSGQAIGQSYGRVVELAPGAKVLVERTVGGEVTSAVLGL